MKNGKKRKTPSLPRSTVLLPIVAANLRRFREAADLTQAQLAARMAVSTRFVELVETGRSGIALETIEHAAGALGKNPRAFFFGKVAP